MTLSLTYRPKFITQDFSSSHATGHEAQEIAKYRERLSESVTSVGPLHGEALEELTDRFLESRTEGWDGYDAEKVEDDAFLRAKALLTRLVNRFPAPTASVSPHGTLTLEWIKHPRRRMILSVGADEQIAYAAVFGDETVQGATSFLHDVPQDITRQLARLYFA